MSHITPKDWNEFQQYKDRKPPWIKLHRNLLDNYDYACLPDASRALAPMMWLLASEFDHGEIELSLDEIAFRLRTNVDYIVASMKPLIKKGFFTSDIDALAERKQPASTEREKEAEGETQTKSETERSAAPKRTPAKVEDQLKLEGVETPKQKPASTKGVRLSPEWKLSTRNTDDARKEGLSEVLMAKEATKFRNYWTALAGAKAVKMNWDATWHNWCIKVAKDNGLTPPPDASVQVFEARTDAQWIKILTIYASTNNWLSGWGPPPGKAGCLVPKHLIKGEGDFDDDNRRT